jgi:uncharacterized protein (TIGR02996 family)
MPGERVADSADELALLRTVTAKLGDLEALGVYNDWLEDQDDPRGSHLRRSLAAFAAGKRLPKRPPEVSAAWEEIVGLGPRRRLRARAATCGSLQPHLPAILDTGQVCIRLELLKRQSMAPVPVGVSRAGGLPDLPVGTVWPMFDDELCGGTWPMQFLVQVNLADLTGTLCEGILAADGLLTLFFYPENEPRGLELRYTPPGVPLERVRPPKRYCFHPHQIGDVHFPTDHTHPLRLVEAMRYPAWVEDLPDELSDFNDVEDNRLAELLYGEGHGQQHFFASRFRPHVCSQWGPKVYFDEVPQSHVELFELSEDESLHWSFGEQLHVFVDPAMARAGAFLFFRWGTI